MWFKYSVPFLLPSLLLSNCKSDNKVTGSTETITIGFAGDTMLGRLVNETIKKEGFLYPWGNILQQLKQHDLNIINLETTLTWSTNAVPKVFNFKSDPPHVQVLAEGNIDVVNIANNHIKDFNDEGLLETIKTLDDAHIKHVGAGISDTKARTPVILEKKGIKIGILGATDNESTWLAGPEKPGTNYFSTDNMQTLLTDITAAKKQADIVIVSLQWGPNKREKPSQDFIKAAHSMVDAGADIIHGHSAHIFQGVEIYKNALIMYDTGDFVDDYAVYPDLRNDRSFIFVVQVTKNGPQKLTLIPILISNMQVNNAPDYDAQESIARMQQLSKQFGTLFKKIDNKAYVDID